MYSRVIGVILVIFSSKPVWAQICDTKTLEDNVVLHCTGFDQQLNYSGGFDVTQLYLTRNNFPHVSWDFFENYLNVVELSMVSNNIRTIDAIALAPMLLLESVDFSENHLTEFDEATFFGNMLLRSIKLSENRLGKLDENLFGNLGDLESLDLSHNEVASLPKHLFEYNANLELLNVSNNRLNCLEDELLSSATNLKIVDFSSNRLKGTPASLFSHNLQLEEISFRNNSIQYVNLYFTRKLQVLRHIDLSWNNISDVEDTTEVEFLTESPGNGRSETQGTKFGPNYGESIATLSPLLVISLIIILMVVLIFSIRKMLYAVPPIQRNYNVLSTEDTKHC